MFTKKERGGGKALTVCMSHQGEGGEILSDECPPPPKRSPDHYFLVDVELLTMMWYCWTVLLSLPVIGKVEMVTK